MLNLQSLLKEEAESTVEFEDECISSNIYLTSLSHSLRSMKGIEITEKKTVIKKWEEENRWLLKKSKHILEVPVINLDSLKMRIDGNRQSCDIFFFNAGFSRHKKHLLGEMKNTSRSEMLKMMDSIDEDSLKRKVISSLNLLRTHISFSPFDTEEKGLEGEIHLFFVYGGKNDTASSIDLKGQLPGSSSVYRDKYGKQSRASRQKRSFRESIKENKEKLVRFSSFAEKKDWYPVQKRNFREILIQNMLLIQRGKADRFLCFPLRILPG